MEGSLQLQGPMQGIKRNEALADITMTAANDASSEMASGSTGGGRYQQLPTPAPRLNKKGKPVGEPKVPGKRYDLYDTAYYTAYDPHQHSQIVKDIPVALLTPSLDYKIYDDYLLFTNPTMTKHLINTIPKTGAATLNRSWPAEFDLKGMPRATRIPLGHAAKMWVTAGDVDVDGNVAAEDDEGWYYKWWKGLQVLMGQEGHDAGLYLVRPSHEFDKCNGMGFKLTHKAVVQEAPPPAEEEGGAELFL